MLKYLFKDPAKAVPIHLYNLSKGGKLITIIRSRTDDLVVESLSDAHKKWKVEGMSNVVNYLVNEKKGIDQAKVADTAFWIYSKFDVNNKLHVASVQDLIAKEDLLSFVVYDRFRTHAGKSEVESNPAVKAWFESMTQKYAAEVENFITKNSGALIDLTKEKKKPVDKKQAAKDKAAKTKDAPAAKAPARVAKKTEEVSKEYKDLVNSQRLKRTTKGQEILPVADKKNILITSALPYVNNVPHLGNLIGAVLSGDTFARFARLRGWNTIYMCGTDEYGTATEYKARLEKKSPKEICDHYNKIHNTIYEQFDLDFDMFLRTTTEKHKTIAQDIFMKIYNRGFLRPKTMMASVCDNCDLALADRFIKGTCPKCKSDNAKGDQCDDCQALLTPDELVNPKCNLCGTEPTKKETEHFFLNLTDIQPDLTAWIEKASVDGKWTSNSIAISKSWLKAGLEERCVTRDLKWGVPVPIKGYEDKVFYVWFDAPIGYISITANYTDGWEKWWKNPDNVKLYQFMGKDNVPFHTVVFPSSLIASGDKWTMLHHISTTEYLQYEDGKFSKSNGTGVFGDDVQKTTIPIDVWRYYLLTNRPEVSDSTFNWEDVQVKNNNELIQNPGNLTNRVLKFIYKNKSKKVPTATWNQLGDTDKKFVQELLEHFRTYVETFEAVRIKDSLKLTMEFSSMMNKYMQDNEVWAKGTDETRQDVVLCILSNGIRLMAGMFEPFMPGFSAKLYFFLGMADRSAGDEVLFEKVLGFGKDGEEFLGMLRGGLTMNEPFPIFERIEGASEYRHLFGGKNKKTG